MMMAEQRPPIFEVHIRPMFRLLDREHMSKWVQLFDLWDLDAVWEQRTEILTRVRDTADMPGDRYGGPWPAEWIAIFERWIETGSDSAPGHHLILTQPDGQYRVQPVSADKRRLTAAITAPSDDCRAWFECDAVTPGAREYTLYLEPAFPPRPADPTPLQALEGFVKGDATKLVIHDANGTHDIALT
jgi:hypothetical protein